MMTRAIAISGLAAMGMAGCENASRDAVATSYQLVDRIWIDDGLMNLLVQTSGPDAEANLDKYADCVAAKSALDRKFGFARHIRTNRTNSGGNWRADAVYSVSSALPVGRQTLEIGRAHV